MSFITVIILQLAEIGYKDPLFKKSLTVIPEIQAGASSTAQSMWKLYSNLGLAIICGAPFMVSFFCEQRVRAIYYLTVLITFTAVQNVTKLAEHSPRPFWVNSDIQAFACSS